jgi:hypothetical protein
VVYRQFSVTIILGDAALGVAMAITFTPARVTPPGSSPMRPASAAVSYHWFNTRYDAHAWSLLWRRREPGVLRNRLRRGLCR